MPRWTQELTGSGLSSRMTNSDVSDNFAKYSRNARSIFIEHRKAVQQNIAPSPNGSSRLMEWATWYALWLVRTPTDIHVAP